MLHPQMGWTSHLNGQTFDHMICVGVVGARFLNYTCREVAFLTPRVNPCFGHVDLGVSIPMWWGSSALLSQALSGVMIWSGGVEKMRQGAHLSEVLTT